VNYNFATCGLTARLEHLTLSANTLMWANPVRRTHALNSINSWATPANGACIPGEPTERHDSSLARPTVQIGSRRRDHWSVTTSSSADGDGRHNRGLIALFVVII
jgi:hypothetical protein